MDPTHPRPKCELHKHFRKPKQKGGGPPTKEEGERHTSANNAKTAQRLLYNYLNQTVWNEEELGNGVALEIQGDNMTSIRWLNGEWRVNKRTYAKQMAEIQDELHTLHKEYRVKGSGAGKISEHTFI